MHSFALLKSISSPSLKLFLRFRPFFGVAIDCVIGGSFLTLGECERGERGESVFKWAGLGEWQRAILIMVSSFFKTVSCNVAAMFLMRGFARLSKTPSGCIEDEDEIEITETLLVLEIEM